MKRPKSASGPDFRASLRYLNDGVFRSGEELREITGFFQTFDPHPVHGDLQISAAQAPHLRELSDTSVYFAESFRQRHVIERSNYRRVTQREGEFSCLPVPGAVVEAFESRTPSSIAGDTFVPNEAKRTVLHLGDSTLNHMRAAVPNQTFRCHVSNGNLTDVTFGAVDVTSLFQDAHVEHLQVSMSGEYSFLPFLLI